MERDCADVKAMLPWIANQSLGDGEAREAWRHLRGCAACRGDLVQWVKLKTQLEPPRAPDDDARIARVWQALQPNTRTQKTRAVFDPFRPPLAIARQTMAWAIAQAATG